jgi:hypothetical protein
MTDHDLEIDDVALAAMASGELVALLDRLYARLGEKRVATSTALASTDDELRDRIHSVRRRLAAKLGEPSLLPPLPPRAREVTDPADTRPTNRVFVVLFAGDGALVARARLACRARGVTLVSVASRETMLALVASVTPTHIVLVGDVDEFAPTQLGDLERRGIRVLVCQDAEHAALVLSTIG